MLLISVSDSASFAGSPLCLPCEKIISVTIASIVTSDSAYKTIRVLFPIPLLLFFLLKYTNSCMFFLSCSSYHIVIKKTKYGNKQDIPKERKTQTGFCRRTTHRSEPFQFLSICIRAFMKHPYYFSVKTEISPTPAVSSTSAPPLLPVSYSASKAPFDCPFNRISPSPADRSNA